MICITRIHLRRGGLIELIYDTAEGAMETAAAIWDHRDVIDNEGGDLALAITDDYGRGVRIDVTQVIATDVSDYAAELRGRLEIARAQAKAQAEVQRASAAQQGLLGAVMPGIVRGNG